MQESGALLGSDAFGPGDQGYSVALSADGNTAIVGGPYDRPCGAAFVYSRSGGIWTQQGPKLVGTGTVTAFVDQGYSVALSADGNIAVVGAPSDNNEVGATWVYKRSGGAWSQQGKKVIGVGGVGPAYQGSSTAISGDGSTFIVGGYKDNSQAGAAWVFASCDLMPCIQAAVSRRVHGAAGTFDLPLSLDSTGPTTEPRQGPTQSVVMTFGKPITSATVTIDEGSAYAGVPTFSGSDVVVPLTGVTDQQYVTVSLKNVASSDGGSGGSAAVRVGFLVGDVNQSHVVAVTDLVVANNQLGRTLSASNFLADVNTSGVITVLDKVIVNNALGHFLPAP